MLLICFGLLAGHTPPARSDDTRSLTRQFEAIDLSRFEAGVGAALRESLTQLQSLEAERETVEPERLAKGYADTGMMFHAHHLQRIAQVCYEAALRARPASPKWAYLLAYSYQESGDFESALRNYRRAIELAPEYPVSRYREAHALALLNRTKEARVILETLARRRPGQAAALALLGDVYLQSGKHAQALGYFQRALKLQPQAGQLHYRLAQAYRGIGDLDKARAHIKRRGSQAPRITDTWLRDMQALSRSSQFFLEIGMRAAAAGKTQSAASIFQQAVRYNPDNEVAHVMLGKSLADLNKSAEAHSHYDIAIKLAPTWPAAHYNKAKLSEAQREVAQAGELFREAIRLDPGYLEARVRYGDLLMRASDYAAAAGEYSQAIALRADNTYLLFQLGLARLAAGECGEAITHFETLLRLRPDHGRAMHAYARAGASCAAADAAQKQRAWKYAKRIFQAQASRAHREALAMAAAALGDFKQAVIHQQSVLEALDAQAIQSTLDSEFARANLRAYRENQAADRAWPAGAAIYRPKPLP